MSLWWDQAKAEFNAYVPIAFSNLPCASVMIISFFFWSLMRVMRILFPSGDQAGAWNAAGVESSPSSVMLESILRNATCSGAVLCADPAWTIIVLPSGAQDQ